MVLRPSLASPDGYSRDVVFAWALENFESAGGDQIGCVDTAAAYFEQLVAARPVDYVVLSDEAGLQAVDIVEVRPDRVARVHLTALGAKYQPGPLHNALSWAVAWLLDFDRWEIVVPALPAVDYMMQQSFVVDGTVEDLGNGFLKCGGRKPEALEFDGEVPLA